MVDQSDHHDKFDDVANIQRSLHFFSVFLPNKYPAVTIILTSHGLSANSFPSVQGALVFGEPGLKACPLFKRRVLRRLLVSRLVRRRRNRGVGWLPMRRRRGR